MVELGAAVRWAAVWRQQRQSQRQRASLASAATSQQALSVSDAAALPRAQGFRGRGADRARLQGGRGRRSLHSSAPPLLCLALCLCCCSALPRAWANEASRQRASRQRTTQRDERRQHTALPRLHRHAEISLKHGAGEISWIFSSSISNKGRNTEDGVHHGSMTVPLFSSSRSVFLLRWKNFCGTGTAHAPLRPRARLPPADSDRSCSPRCSPHFPPSSPVRHELCLFVVVRRAASAAPRCRSENAAAQQSTGAHCTVYQ